MNTKKVIVGIAQVLLSLALLMAGLMKMATPYEELIVQMAWTKQVSPFIVFLIGLLEVLGVLGMNLPYVLKKYKKLVPIAAAGLTLTMFGAIMTHLLLGESIIAALVLFIIAGFVTYSRRHLYTNTSL